MLQNNTTYNSTASFLAGGGEMGKLIREYNWAGSALGHPDQWPKSLLTTVNIMLNTKFAMFLWWGPELIQFYNDDYRRGLGNPGKHPKALGQRGEECWPELWDTIKPMIDSVLTTGETAFHEDMPIKLYRNGNLEDSYWTFSYSKVNGDTGNAEGVVVICTETTGKVIAKQTQALNEDLISANNNLTQVQTRLQQTIQELEDSELRISSVIGDAPVAVAILESTDLIIKSANKKMLEFLGKTERIIGMPMHMAVPELQGQPFISLYLEVLKTGEPYYGYEFRALLEHNNKIEEGFYNFVFHPLKDNNNHTHGLMIVATDVTGQANARKKVELAEENLRLAIDAADLGTYYINMADEVFMPSPRLKEFFGYLPHEEVPYEASVNQIHPDYREMVASSLEAAIMSGERFDIEYPVIGYHDSKLRWVRNTGTVQYDNDGTSRYFTGVLHDITRNKEDELRKNDFIGIVSHELKTPLTSLTAIIQVLSAKLKNSEDTFIAGALERAGIQAKKMKGLIDGFFNISRLETGKILLYKKSFMLDRLIGQAIEEASQAFSSHQLTFLPCEQLSIFADRDKIGSVINNLLNNAVKYSAKGKTVEICCTDTGENVRVSIRDEGIGIKPEDLEKLFDRYHRVDSNNIKNIFGLGVGLYLSAEIIRQHNGKIWAESEFGKGSTFYFELPINETANAISP